MDGHLKGWNEDICSIVIRKERIRRFANRGGGGGNTEQSQDHFSHRGKDKAGF